MRLARRAPVIALAMLTLCVAASAQTLRSEGDPRNIAPAVGTGSGPGGPTGLFTVYDGQTLRKGEFTISFAYSNFDRDPGNVDITEIPVSVQVGLNDYLEVFANSDYYRGIKVNSPRNLSAFYLPNSRFFNVGKLVLAPITTGGIYSPGVGNPVFSAPGDQPRIAFPYVGGNAGTYGLPSPSSFALGASAGSSSGNFGGAGLFPGIGSTYGSILPGVVLATGASTPTLTVGAVTTPTSFTTAPTYLPDAPFLDRIYGTSSFNKLEFGAKIRFTDPESPVGFGVIPFYRYYLDRADDAGGFNMLSRGASPGANFGDLGAILFLDGRLSRSINMSVNAGYIVTGNPKSDLFGGDEITLLDRPDEFHTAIGFDFPVNRYFQPIAEFRTTQYVGGRTPNAFENSPIEMLAGVRIYPRRFMGLSVAYRRHLNQQSGSRFESGVPSGFIESDDPSGFMAQFFIGRRNERAPEFLPNQPPTATLTSSAATATVCPIDASRAQTTVQLTTQATDPDGDTLLYTYSVTGGRITGEGPNVSWDLSGVNPGSYTSTVEVNDGCGCVSFATTTVNVEECPPPTPTPTPPCPQISIDCPTSVVPQGTAATFTANISGGDTSITPGFNWTVSAGTITSGQGTNSITVDTTGVEGNVTATLNVSGLAASCAASSSCTIQVGPPPRPREFVEFNFVTFDDAKANLDNFAVELQNAPTSTGTIIVYAGPRDRAGEAERVGNRLRNYLVNNRGIEAGRITVVDGGLRPEKAVELYIALPGQPAPVPEPDPNVVAQPRRAPRRRR